MKNCKTILIIALFTISCTNLLSAQDFVFPDFEAHPPFREMKCGLWINSAGDIAYKTFGCDAKHENEGITADSSNIFIPEYEPVDYYITWCYYVRDTITDSMNETDYMSELKNVVDTSSFKILSPFYFTDKNHVYIYTDMACGGHIGVSRNNNRKTFNVFKSNPAFACGKYTCFVMGRSIDGSDSKTFQPIKYKDHLYSRDKNHVYHFDRPMTETEIVEAEAEKKSGIQLR